MNEITIKAVSNGWIITQSNDNTVLFEILEGNEMNVLRSLISWVEDYFKSTAVWKSTPPTSGIKMEWDKKPR